jgi:hypothetical protein
MEEKMQASKTLGTAIDEVVAALRPLDETSRRTALMAVCDHLGITLGPPSTHAPLRSLDAQFSQAPAGPPSGRVPHTDIRSFAQTKMPATAIEQVTLVAFYLSELAPPTERKEAIDKGDLKKYFKQADFPLPKRPEVTLVHAKNAGYLDAAGEGKYRLNPVGYNLIAHNLPRERTEPREKPGRAKRSRQRRVGRNRPRT